jgi:ABC-type multidrug transport system ATPase subunit
MVHAISVFRQPIYTPIDMATERSGWSAAGETTQLVVRTRRSDHRLSVGSSYRIGRDPSADIVLTDDRVSWRHAELRLEDGSWVLVDSGSTNGTFVGTRRVERIEISDNCVVRLGNPDDGPLLRCEPQRPPAPLVPPPAPAPGLASPQVPAPQPQEPRQAAPPRPAEAPIRGPIPTPPVIVPSHATPDDVAEAALPSVDRRPTARLPLPAQLMRIGRTPENDVVLSDLSVSKRHAELRKSPSGQFEILDIGSRNGTFVNGKRVHSAMLTESDLVSIGNATFRLADGELREFVDEGSVSLAARELTVKAGSKVLLDRVTFPIPERSFVGVIGPSGAGKSTLLGALTGMRPAGSGTVLYDNRDLYKNYAELRHRIGLVPQDSVMHTQLTARRALRYSAELRFPSDTRRAERDKRVSEVMTELALTRHADTRADRLSGGQLKRVNVALELLTRPSLLFLDEPTSGLDPGLDKSVMEQMRDLAHDGRTVIVVTHSVANLDTCDRLLVLVPGGKIAYYGPPADGLRYFKQRGWAEVFQAFEAQPDRDWAGEFAASPEHTLYVAGIKGPRQASSSPPEVPAAPSVRRGRLRQVSTLTRRYLRVIGVDRGYLAFIALLPVVLGALLRFVPSPEGLAGAPGTNADAEELLLIMAISACFAGAANSARELVKERSIYVRERAAGLSVGAYLWSTVLVLGVISVVQALLLVGIGIGGRRLPPTGSFLTNLPIVELLLGVGGLAFASMCLGLLISSLVSTSEKAMPFLVLLTMVQVILSGGVFSLTGMAGLSQLSWLAPARWGFGATASTASLNSIAPGISKPDPLWKHDPGAWLTDMGLQLGLGLIFLIIAWWRLNRLTPGRRRGA